MQAVLLRRKVDLVPQAGSAPSAYLGIGARLELMLKRPSGAARER